MAAPLLVVPAAFVAFLGAAHLAPWMAGVAAATTEIDGVVVDLGQVCKATDPLLDALADRARNTPRLAAIARAADSVCAAAAGSGVAADIELVIATLQAIHSAETELRAGPAVAPIADPSAHAKAGR